MKKADLKRLDESLDKALAPPGRKPMSQVALNSLLDEYDERPASQSDPSRPTQANFAPLAETATQVDIATKAENASQAKSTSQAFIASAAISTSDEITAAAAAETFSPRQIAAVAKSTSPAKSANLLVQEVKGELRIPNTIVDNLFPHLDPTAAMLYLRLYRLSHGYRKEVCTVGRERLAKALNTSSRTVFRAIETLEGFGLIERVGAHFGGSEKGNTFKVNLPATQAKIAWQAKIASQEIFATAEAVAGNKDDDDHDSLNQSHHQSAPVENPGATMIRELYSELTGRAWGEGDEAQLRQLLDDVEPAAVLDLMRPVCARARDPIGSFAFIATSVRREGTGKAPRGKLRDRYRKLASEVAATYTGADLRPSDRVAALKDRTVRAGLVWDDDLANEVLGLS